jgi:hypothetical protein
MKHKFGTLTRGSKHGEPKKDADIKLLEGAYEKAKLHHYILGRTAIGTKRDRASDFILAGAVKLQATNTIETWSESRHFRRSHQKDYGDEEDISDSNY